MSRLKIRNVQWWVKHVVNCNMCLLADHIIKYTVSEDRKDRNFSVLSPESLFFWCRFPWCCTFRSCDQQTGGRGHLTERRWNRLPLQKIKLLFGKSVTVIDSTWNIGLETLNTLYYNSGCMLRDCTGIVLCVFFCQIFPRRERNFTSEAICSWVFEHHETVLHWLQPPGTKSRLLERELTKGPALLLFLPHNPLGSKPNPILQQVSRDGE